VLVVTRVPTFALILPGLLVLATVAVDRRPTPTDHEVRGGKARRS